jgi:hypothetical protein
MGHSSVFKKYVLKGRGIQNVVSHCCVLANLRNVVTGLNLINFSKRILIHGVSGLNWNRTTKWKKSFSRADCSGFVSFLLVKKKKIIAGFSHTQQYILFLFLP